MDLKVFTSFSGYDSQCMALDRLEIGYDLVGWSEIDKYAIAAHNAVYPQYAERNYGDICNIKWSEVPSFNLFTYSSPCQDFSNAGLQRGGQEGSGTRSSLLWECGRAIECKRPDYLLMENVAALVSDKFIKLFNKWQITLEGYGYINYAKVLNAKDYGVPQNRVRIFMVSVRKGLCHKFYFPKPFKLERRLKDVLEYNVDEKYYLSGERLNGLVSSTQKEEERGNGFKFDPKTEEDIATTVQTSGGSRKTDNFVIVPKIGAIRTRCKGNWVKGAKILSYSRDNKGKNRYEGGFRIRKLTPTECFRLMDVDDTYLKRLLESGISNSQLYKLAGNSIVVSCMYHIFRKLFVDTESEDGQLTIF